MEAAALASLPATISWAPGRLTITCRNMEHLIEQLVLIAKALDTDYAALRAQVERPLPKTAQMEAGDFDAPAAPS